MIYLTSETFRIAINEKQTFMVNFFAPWCGHCKSSLQEYVKAASIAKNEKLNGIQLYYKNDSIFYVCTIHYIFRISIF